MAQSALDTLVTDMTLGSEALPHGLVADWAYKPRAVVGNDPAKYGFSQILGWGVAYEAATGNGATNTRVEVNNIQLWVLSKSTGQWTLMQSSAPNGIAGGMFAENFAADVNEVAATRREADGGLSAKPGNARDWHFWANNVAMAIDPNDIGGVVMSYDARLVVDDPTKADDRASAKYVAAAGTDYWNATMTANGDAAIGRFKTITSSYQSFTMSTLSAAQLAANPPVAYLAQFAPSSDAVPSAAAVAITNTVTSAAQAASTTLTTPAAPTTQTTTAAATATPASPAAAVFRFYDQATGDHFYTTDPTEKAKIQASNTQLVYEGAPWAAPAQGANTVDVYRFYDTVTQTHFFTTDANERNSILAHLPSFTYEGIAFEAYVRPGGADTITLERFYNTATQLHHFALPGEAADIRTGAAGANWVDEGAAFTVHKPV